MQPPRSFGKQLAILTGIVGLLGSCVHAMPTMTPTGANPVGLVSTVEAAPSALKPRKLLSEPDYLVPISHYWASTLGKQAGSRSLKMQHRAKQMALDSLNKDGTDATVGLAYAFRSPTGYQYLSNNDDGTAPRGIADFALRRKFIKDGAGTPTMPAGATATWAFTRGGQYGFGTVLLPVDNGDGQYHINPGCPPEGNCCPFMTLGAVDALKANPGNRRFALHDLASVTPDTLASTREQSGCADESFDSRWLFPPYALYQGNRSTVVSVELQPHLYAMHAGSTQIKYQDGGAVFWWERQSIFGCDRSTQGMLTAVDGLDDATLAARSLPDGVDGPGLDGGLGLLTTFRLSLSPPGPNVPTIYEDDDGNWQPVPLNGRGPAPGLGGLALVDIQISATSFKEGADQLGIAITIDAADPTWTLDLQDATGKPLGTIATGTGDTNVPWDGKISGVYVPKGTYTLHVHSNGKDKSAQVTIDSAQVPMTLSVSDPKNPADTSGAFSPNRPTGDGVKDTLNLNVTSTVDWQMTLQDPNGSTLTAAKGTGSAGLQAVPWDGTAKDSLGNGIVLKDGKYILRLTARGASPGPSDPTATAVIDTVAPTISNIKIVPKGADDSGLTYSVTATCNDAEPSSGLQIDSGLTVISGAATPIDTAASLDSGGGFSCFPKIDATQLKNTVLFELQVSDKAGNTAKIYFTPHYTDLDIYIEDTKACLRQGLSPYSLLATGSDCTDHMSPEDAQNTSRALWALGNYFLSLPIDDQFQVAMVIIPAAEVEEGGLAAYRYFRLRQNYMSGVNANRRVANVVQDLVGTEVFVRASEYGLLINRRIDVLTKTTIIEVKSNKVTAVRLTKQIKDYKKIADQDKMIFEIWIRSNAKIDQKLVDWALKNHVQFKTIPGL